MNKPLTATELLKRNARYWAAMKEKFEAESQEKYPWSYSVSAAALELEPMDEETRMFFVYWLLGLCLMEPQ